MEFEIRKNVMWTLPPGRALTLWPGRFSALSFEGWHLKRLLDRVQPAYTLLSGNRLATLRQPAGGALDGKRRGTSSWAPSLTRPDCRRQGLAKRLMEEVLRDWADRCDGMFLFCQ